MAQDRYGSQGRYDRDSSIFSSDDNDRWRRERDDGGTSGRTHGGSDDRGLLDRAGDEVRSWFGDEEAERRRERDARRYESERGYDERFRADRHDNQWSGRPSSDQGRGRQSEGEGRSSRAGSSQFDPYSGASYGAGGRNPGSHRNQTYGQQGYGQASYGDTGRLSRQSVPSSRPQGAREHQGWQSGQSAGEQGGDRSRFGQSGQGFGEGSQGASMHDQNYRRWRDQQIAQLDREYDEYCRHRQQQFESEFTSFRQSRQGSQPDPIGQGDASRTGSDTLSAANLSGGQPDKAAATTTPGGNASATTAGTGGSNDGVGADLTRAKGR